MLPQRRLPDSRHALEHERARAVPREQKLELLELALAPDELGFGYPHKKTVTGARSMEKASVRASGTAKTNSPNQSWGNPRTERAMLPPMRDACSGQAGERGKSRSVVIACIASTLASLALAITVSGAAAPTLGAE